MPFELDMTRAARAGEYVKTSEQMAEIGHSQVRHGTGKAAASGVVTNSKERTKSILQTKRTSSTTTNVRRTSKAVGPKSGAAPA